MQAAAIKITQQCDESHNLIYLFPYWFFINVGYYDFTGSRNFNWAVY